MSFIVGKDGKILERQFLMQERTTRMQNVHSLMKERTS